MNVLKIEWPKGSVEVEPGRTYVVGRGASSDVKLDDPQISRHHLDLDFDGSHWVATDRSSAGTFVGDERITIRTIDQPTTFRLGPPGAPEVVLSPQVQAAPLPAPVVDVPDARTIAVDDQALRLEIGGVQRVFPPGATITVGRGEECDLIADDQLVSRTHCRFTHAKDHWVVEDLGSTRGTFIDGQKLRGATPISGSFSIGLGDPAAGQPLRVVTAGEHRPPSGKTQLWAFGALAGLLVVAVVAAVIFWPSGGGGPNSESQLLRAQRATVLILIFDGDENLAGTCSGAVIDRNGSILTNRHCVGPDDGRGGFGILTVDDPSEPVEPAYFAELVEVAPGGYDAALLRVVADENGQPVTEVDIAPLTLGDPSRASAGSRANQLGFPGLAETSEISVSEVTIQSFAPIPECESSVVDSSTAFESRCVVPGFPTEDARMNFTGADLGGGSSGGPFVRNGEILAINVGAALQENQPDQEYALSVEVLTDWLSTQL